MAAWIDEDVLVHVGMHKTATTWLQRHYFLRQNGYWTPESDVECQVKETVRSLIMDARGRCIPDEEFDGAAIQTGLARATKPHGLMAVASSERLGGHPFSNGFDRRQLAQRLKVVFPRASILLVIREQASAMMSNYMQYLKYGGWHTPEQYLDGDADNRMPTLTSHYWDYARLIRMYHDIFSPDRVLVLPYEMFRREPGEFLRRIGAFAGVAMTGSLPSGTIENPRRAGNATAYFTRHLTCLSVASSANAFYRSPLGRIGHGLNRIAKITLDGILPSPVERHVTRALEARINAVIGDRYAESNRTTATLIGIDLSAFAYRV